MAEILKFSSGLPSFSEVLDIISNWSQRGSLSDREKKKAKEELESCLEALQEKTDGMSGMVRSKVTVLLNELGMSCEDEREIAE